MRKKTKLRKRFGLNSGFCMIDSKGKMQLFHKFDQLMWERLHRLLELLPKDKGDKQTLVALDRVIASLEEPKADIGKQVADKLVKDTDMAGVIMEALMTLKMRDLQYLQDHLQELEMKRGPGKDCLIVNAGRKQFQVDL